MPVLADALEDAGCVDEALLAHCRASGAHVRGCWAVDLLLKQCPSQHQDHMCPSCSEPPAEVQQPRIGEFEFKRAQGHSWRNF